MELLSNHASAGGQGLLLLFTAVSLVPLTRPGTRWVLCKHSPGGDLQTGGLCSRFTQLVWENSKSQQGEKADRAPGL